MDPIVVNVSVKYIRPKYQNLEQWINDPENLYIARGGVVFINGERFPKESSPYHNPFKITNDTTRENVIKQYSEYLDKNPELVERAKIDLIGKKRVGCWCKVIGNNIPCHGDILLEKIKKLKK